MITRIINDTIITISTLLVVSLFTEEILKVSIIILVFGLWNYYDGKTRYKS